MKLTEYHFDLVILLFGLVMFCRMLVVSGASIDVLCAQPDLMMSGAGGFGMILLVVCQY